MNFFSFDFRKAIIILIFVVAFPLISVNLQRGPGEPPWYQRPFAFLAGSLQDGYSGFTSGVRGTVSEYLKLIGIKREIQKLEQENQELRAQIGAMNENKLENERLSQLINFKSRTSMKLMAAKVIGRDLSADRYSLRINRGSRDGLKHLQAVITVDGVVGYVFRPEANTAQILGLTDRLAAVDAIVTRTRARGIIQGRDRTSCRLKYLERADDVAIGDIVATSGIGGLFPKGFPIGKIIGISKTEMGISQEAQVMPIVNAGSVEEVFVVVDSGNQDFFTDQEESKKTTPPQGEKGKL